MKTKIFDVVLHDVPQGKSPASHLENQINKFLEQHPHVQIIASHMNTVTLPPEAAAAYHSANDGPSVVIFVTLFYNS